MAKRGKRGQWNEAGEELLDVDAFLFGAGLSASDYTLSADGVIGFKDRNGREFDLIIDHPRLEAAALVKLKALGVSETFGRGG